MVETGENFSPVDMIQEIQQLSRDELFSLKVTIANRRIIVALCENDRGRYIKLTDGRARLFVPSSGFAHLCEALSSLNAHFDPSDMSANSTSYPSPADPQVYEPSIQGPLKSQLIHSQRFSCEGRKYYLDILENARGRYLKISQASHRRVTLILNPAFVPQLRKAISIVIDKSPPDTSVPLYPSTVQRVTRTLERVATLNDGPSVTVNVVQREIRVLGKRIIFESSINRRGSYLKIMENSGPNRATVVLPHSTVPEVIQLLEEAVANGDPADGITTPQMQTSPDRV